MVARADGVTASDDGVDEVDDAGDCGGCDADSGDNFDIDRHVSRDVSIAPCSNRTNRFTHFLFRTVIDAIKSLKTFQIVNKCLKSFDTVALCIRSQLSATWFPDSPKSVAYGYRILYGRYGATIYTYYY